MPKSAVAGRGVRKDERSLHADVANVAEGQITEICRELAVHAKRTRQLQEQADELRTVIRQWAGGFDAGSSGGSTSRR
jgi:hypothetical protein